MLNILPIVEGTLGLLQPQALVAAEVSLDITAAISAVLFLLVWIALKFLIFDPYLKIVEERETQIEGARDNAASMEVRAEEALLEYERRIKGARADASQAREELRDAAESTRESMLGDARQNAQAFLQQRREQLSAEVADAEKVIETNAVELSKAIVDRVLPARG